MTLIILVFFLFLIISCAVAFCVLKAIRKAILAAKEELSKATTSGEGCKPNGNAVRNSESDE